MPQAHNAKTHIVWAALAVVAFVAGRQFAGKEIVVVEKPVEVVRTREVVVEKPVAVAASAPAAPPASASPSAVASARKRSRA